MKSMIIETCFVEATEDVELYKKLGADAIGKAIAEAIVNGKDSENTTFSQYFFVFYPYASILHFMESIVNDFLCSCTFYFLSSLFSEPGNWMQL